MTPTDFTHATVAHHPVTGQTATRDLVTSGPTFPWQSDSTFPDGSNIASDRQMSSWGFIPGPAPVEEEGPTTIPSWEDISEDVREAMVERGRARYMEEVGGGYAGLIREVLAAALTPEPARPEWADLADVLLRAGVTHGDDLARALHEAGVRAPEVGQS